MYGLMCRSAKYCQLLIAALPSVALGQCIEINSCTVNALPVAYEFSIQQLYQTPADYAAYQTPLLADLNGDCIPELIVASNENAQTNPRITRDLVVLNTETGDPIYTIPTAYFGWSCPNSYAIADVDNDGIPDVVLAASAPSNPESTSRRLVCYELDGTVKWIANAQFGLDFQQGFGGSVNIADFNGDGIPEVYIYNEIYNAQTGVLLASGGDNGAALGDMTSLIGQNASPVAAQLDSNINDLELACGYTVYDVTLSNPNGLSGNSMTPLNISVGGQQRDGFTSVADINLDGTLDVVVASMGVGNGILYVYTVVSGSPQLIAQVNPPNGGGPLNYKIGQPVVGRLDDSGTPTIAVTRANRLLTYQYNGSTTLQLKWSLNTVDQSGETGLTLFDFNLDGVNEIVYRDETQLRILNGSGTTAEILTSFTCPSGTGVEYPIVGDLTNSGQSAICVTCGLALQGRIHVFGTGDDNEPWSPARGIWNQFAYNVTNINDDLTVPPVPILNATALNGALNNFLVQSVLFNDLGNPIIPLPDLSVSSGCTTVNPTTGELELSFAISFQNPFQNVQGTPITIALYNGSASSSIELDALLLTVEAPIPANSSETWLTIPVTDELYSLTDQVYIVINYLGESFSPSNEEGFQSIECEYNNNVTGLISLPPTSNEDATICFGQSYVFFDLELTESGDYIFHEIDDAGCVTAVHQLNLEVGVATETTSTAACDSYFWEATGQTITESGSYSMAVSNENGCDSLFVLNLDVFPNYNLAEDLIACEPVVKDGTLMSESGTYSIFLETVQGCDSIVNVQFTLQEPGFSEILTSLCENDILILDDGTEVTQAGSYTVTYPSLFQGCDSTAITQVSIIDVPVTLIDSTICEGSEFILPDNSIVSPPGTFSYVTQSMITGCDSIVEFVVYVTPPPFALFEFETNSVNLCESEQIIAFSFTGANNQSVVWELGDGNTSLEESFTHSYTQAGVYPVQLTVENPPCSPSTFSSDIVVELIPESHVTDLPPINVVSANADGINDCLFFNHEGSPAGIFEDFVLRVFNRWGTLVHESKGINSQWCPNDLHEGSYFYIVSYTDRCSGEAKVVNQTLQVVR